MLLILCGPLSMSRNRLPNSDTQNKCTRQDKSVNNKHSNIIKLASPPLNGHCTITVGLVGFTELKSSHLSQKYLFNIKVYIEVKLSACKIKKIKSNK